MPTSEEKYNFKHQMLSDEFLQGLVSDKDFTEPSKGNVYNLLFLFLEDAKRKSDGTQKNARTQTWFSCILA
jgi:hypothetical protein